MPVTPTFPGIYIEEIASNAHTITAAPTSVAVFVGYTHPFKTKPENWNNPVEIFGFTDYERQFGGFFKSDLFFKDSQAAKFGDLAQAVNQFFLNGGSDAWVIGLQPSVLGNFQAPTVSVGPFTLTAKELTDDQNQMIVTVNVAESGSPATSPPMGETADITISYGPKPGSDGSVPKGTLTETYRQVSLNETDGGQPNPNYLVNRLAGSGLVSVTEVSPPVGQFVATTKKFANAINSPPSDIFDANDFVQVFQQDQPLDKLAIFNLLVIPGVVDTLVLNTALAFCERKRAFLIMDPPREDTADDTNKIQDAIAGPAMPKGKNGALYFPYLKSPDPLTGLSINPVTNKAFEIPPSGTVAGIFARTDVDRGVWKAPAGLEATTVNTTGVVDRGRMTDQRQGVLNPLGVNVLRDFPNVGTVVFGARTLVTVTEEQWRYVPVRRMALFLEQTLYANLGWVIFEPNDEPLWTAIKTSIEAFMLGLFRQQAFQGDTPSKAFLVKCDDQTTTQEDINNGIVNIVVGFAPLKPAEFVIIKISQLAGQSQTS